MGQHLHSADHAKKYNTEQNRPPKKDRVAQLPRTVDRCQGTRESCRHQQATGGNTETGGDSCPFQASASTSLRQHVIRMHHEELAVPLGSAYKFTTPHHGNTHAHTTPRVDNCVPQAPDAKVRHQHLKKRGSTLDVLGFQVIVSSFRCSFAEHHLTHRRFFAPVPEVDMSYSQCIFSNQGTWILNNGHFHKAFQ